MMNLINKPLLDKTLEFLGNLKDERVAVIHHTDPDGVCSGVIVSKAVEKIRGTKIDLRTNQNSSELFISEATLQKLKENRITKVIITDMSVDQDVKENFVDKIPLFADLLIIDHHKLYRDLNSDKITLIKPHMIYENVNSAQYCAAKFSYDLCSMITDLKDIDWVACIGIIGDVGYETWKTFVDDTLQKYNIAIPDDIFQSDIGRIAELISCTEAYDIKKTEEVFQLVYNAKSHHDILNSELKKYKEDVEKEIAIWKNNFDTKAEKHNEILYYFIKPKYPIKSNLCTILSFTNPNKTIIIVQIMPGEELATVSARRRDGKVAVNELLESATKGLEQAGGGGHIPAAGGRFLIKDEAIFKKKVLSWQG